MPRRHHSKSRTGAVIVLVALFLVVVLAVAAFSTDVGYICLAQTQLQTAADAAALAGAQQCLLPGVPGSAQFDAVCAQTVRQAQSAAASFARRNQAGGVGVSLPSADITVGYQSSSPGAAVTAWQAGQPAPNAVRVVARRDATANGPLALFFAPLLGVEHSSLQAVATAAYETGRYSVTGFQPAGQNAKLLPIAIDVNTWTQFRNSGCSADGVCHDDYTAELVLPDSPVRPPANVSAGGDGIPELLGAYPLKTAPGNFGTVDLSASGGGCGNANVSSWILNGASAGDLSSFGPQGLEATPAAPASMRGNPGLTSSDVRDFAAIVGQPRIVPLYSSYSGNGANACYSIVGFAGVTVVHAAGAGSNISIILQPALVVDPTAATSSSAATLGDFVYPRVPLALTQ